MSKFRRSSAAGLSVRSVALWLGVLFLGCSRSADRADDRPDRVLNRLRPPVAIKGAPVVRWSLDERMRALRVPGVSVAIIDSGRVVWARGFGIKEGGGTDSVTTETLFQAQSISKPIAVTGLLRLVEAGKLDLDDDVNTVLHSWRLPTSRFTDERKVTLRAIASHSAGLTVGGFPGYRLGDSLPTLAQILDGQRPANNPPVRVDTFPRAISRYSGGGMEVMRQVMTDVTGEDFPVLMRRLVLAPLGMTRSRYDQPLPEAVRQEAASGHDGSGAVIPGKWVIQPELAAAGLWTTPTELAAWAIDVANAWAGRDAKLLSSGMAKEMLTRQKANWGLGVSVEDSGAALRFGHSGSNRGFRAELVMLPAVGKGAVVLTNGDRGSGIIEELLQSIAAEYHWPGYQQVEREVIALGATELDGLVGEYLTPGPGNQPIVIAVSREGERLVFEVTGFVPKTELYPAGGDSFFTISGSDVFFKRNRAGQGETISLARQIEGKRTSGGPKDVRKDR